MANQLESDRWGGHYSQKYTKLRRDLQKKGYDPKAEKSELRKRKDERFVQGWIKNQSELNLDPKQRFNLALRRGNDMDIQLISNEMDDAEKFGYRVETHTFQESVSTVNAKIA